MARRTRSSATLAPAFVAVAAFALAAPQGSPGQDGPARRALARLAALTGEWEGSFEWTGGRTSRGAMNARYFTTGNGSTVVETLTVDGVPSMTTVYHLDGPDLSSGKRWGSASDPRPRP